MIAFFKCLCLGIFFLLQDVFFIILFFIFLFLACGYFFCDSNKHKRFLCYKDVNGLIDLYYNSGNRDDYFYEFYDNYVKYKNKLGIKEDEYFIRVLNDWLDVTDLKDFFTYFSTLISLIAIIVVFFQTEIKIAEIISITIADPVFVYLLVIFVCVFVSGCIYFRDKKLKVLHVKNIIQTIKEMKPKSQEIYY